MRWRFIDRVTRFEPWSAIEGVKAVSLEEYGLLEPLGRKGQFPETLVLEAGVHLARWLVAASSAFEQSGELDRVDGFALHGDVRAGAALGLSLAVTRRDAAAIGVAADVRSAGRLVASGAFGLSLSPLRETAVPEDQRTLWRELYAQTSGA